MHQTRRDGFCLPTTSRSPTPRTPPKAWEFSGDKSGQEMLGEGSLVTCWNWQPAAFLISCKQQGQEDSMMGVWIPNTLVLVSTRLWHFPVLSCGMVPKRRVRIGWALLACTSEGTFAWGSLACLPIPRASLKLQRILWHAMISERAQDPVAEGSSLSCARLSQRLSAWP